MMFANLRMVNWLIIEPNETLVVDNEALPVPDGKKKDRDYFLT